MLQNAVAHIKKANGGNNMFCAAGVVERARPPAKDCPALAARGRNAHLRRDAVVLPRQTQLRAVARALLVRVHRARCARVRDERVRVACVAQVTARVRHKAVLGRPQALWFPACITRARGARLARPVGPQVPRAALYIHIYIYIYTYI